MQLDTAVYLREPFPPNRVLGIVQPDQLRYGFILNDGTAFQFMASRADPNDAAMFALGNMVSVERTDGLHPWLGFITTAKHSLHSSVSTLVCKDLHDALWMRARTPKAWPEQVASSGSLIQRIFLDANNRAEPPLLTEAPAALGGPVVPFTPRAETVADFMRTMVEFSGWEWLLIPELRLDGIRAQLLWAGATCIATPVPIQKSPH